VASFATKAEAEKAAERFRKQIPGRTKLDFVFDQYEEYLRAKGNKPASVQQTLWRMKVWLDPLMPAADVTPAMMTHKYMERCARLAVDSHRGELAEVKTFWRWCVKQGMVARSPAEHVEPVGRRHKGKKQLRWAEARSFYAVALNLAHNGDQGAVAALAVLLLGLRSGEIRARKIRDVDLDDDRVLLWVDKGKTEAATRYMEAPEPLASLLIAQAGDRPPDDWLFPAESAAGHRGTTWLRKVVRRLCKVSGVPAVTVHGLRGTWATLSTDAGVTGHVVARELGHTNPAVTREHYTQKGAEDRARSRRMLRLVVGGRELAGEVLNRCSSAQKQRSVGDE
jgi:integrase